MSGAATTSGTGARFSTGSGANVETGSGANVRRFQGETLGLRNRSTAQQPAEPQRHNIATPPSQPTCSTLQPPDLQLPRPSALEQPPLVQQPPVQQPLLQQQSEPLLSQGTPRPLHGQQSSSSNPPPSSSMAPRRLGVGDQGPQLAQRTALVTALQARASRMVGWGHWG